MDSSNRFIALATFRSVSVVSSEAALFPRSRASSNRPDLYEWSAFSMSRFAEEGSMFIVSTSVIASRARFIAIPDCSHARSRRSTSSRTWIAMSAAGPSCLLSARLRTWMILFWTLESSAPSIPARTPSAVVITLAILSEISSVRPFSARSESCRAFS